MFMVMCACAIGFTSCGNKAQQAPADEVVASDEAIDVEAAIGEATAQLTEQIEANDAGKLQQALEAVQAKIAEILKANPDAAKEYVAKVQDFLKENADKIKAVAGENAAVQAAVSTLTSAPAETIVSGLLQAVDGVKAAGEDAVDAAQDAVDGVVDAGKDKLKEVNEDLKDAAKEKVNEGIDATADKAKKALGL